MIKLETTTAYTVPETAKILGKNCDTVRRYIKEGKLRAQKVGHAFYITDKSLTIFVTGEKPELRWPDDTRSD